MLDTLKSRRSAGSKDGADDRDSRDPAISTFIDYDPRNVINPDYHAHRDPERNPQRRAELDKFAKRHGGFNRQVARPGLLNQRKEGGKYYVVDSVGRGYIATHYPDSETGEPVKTIKYELLTAHLSEADEFKLFLDIGNSVRPTTQTDLFVGLAKQDHMPEKEQYEALLSTGFELPNSGARGVPHITLSGVRFGWGPNKTGMTKEERHEPKNANVLKRALFILKNTWVANGNGNAVKKKNAVAAGSLSNTDVVAVMAFMKAYPEFNEARLRQILNENDPEVLRRDARDWLRAGGYQQNTRFVAYREAYALVGLYCHGLKELPRLDHDALKFETNANDAYNAFPKKKATTRHG